ncbi:alkyl hydroperoxide reductase subunit F [Paenalcaligenes niemegkensis]|uniref:alkyl hydroperoxide reductase subunit F n=1 Tax=Paenalcaligenes niemegkensis TaxID=2895469 RepID=UPI001EE834BC|nr:alkyl hydroperoxide reductase subunit F [Paenalcaligenes niemegkensis]MCQ9615324.1 alkyl hydroperoxide reductase subunit F [Paenalcaligenes niemegkensis]
MLDANLVNQLKAYLEKIAQPIEIVASLDDGEKSLELRQLLNQIVEQSDKISYREETDNTERKPSFRINRVGSDISVAFAGIPLGHEFASLVLALLQVGGHAVKFDESTIKQIQSLEGDMLFEVYYSLSCQNCPDVVQALNAMAVINPRIRPVAIDGAINQDEVAKREVMSVPAVYLNGEVFHHGRASVEELLAKLDAGDSEAQADAINQREVFDVLVVGGGPAGAAAAVYAARKGIRTGVVAERFGGQVLDTMSIENYISVVETDGPKFAAALEEHVKAYDVDVMNLQRAEALIPGKEIQLKLSNGGVLKAKSVVLATGARWRELGVEGEQKYRNRGVAYCPHCDGPLYKGKDVAVVGGGNSGVEAAIDLAGLVNQVTLLEFGDQLRADEVLQRKLHSLPNVTVITQAQTTQVLGDGSKVTALQYTDRSSGESHDIALDGVFVQIGLVPNTEWLKGSIDLSKYGEIEVNDRAQTSVPGVFAAGDATTVPFKQIIIAAGQGATAALSAFDHLIRSSVEEEEEVTA